MTVLELSAVTHGALVGAGLSLGAGVHAVLGTPADGTTDLVAIAAGIVRPRRGRVLVAGHEPHRSPDIRRRIAALLARERLIPAATVQASVARALAIAGAESAPAGVLEASGLGSWAARPLTSLDAAERRSVALAIALARREPLLVALHEPLGVPGAARRQVKERIARLAERGACVLCTTASARDGGELSSSLLLLDRGRVVRRAAPSLGVDLAPGTVPDFVVQSDNPRLLTAGLSADPAVTGVEWDQQHSPRAIRVRGTDPAELALAIARAALSQSIQVSSVSPALPALEIVRGASDGLGRAAYEQAYRKAQEQARAPLRAEPRRPAPGTPLYAPPAASSGPPADDKPSGGGGP